MLKLFYVISPQPSTSIGRLACFLCVQLSNLDLLGQVFLVLDGGATHRAKELPEVRVGPLVGPELVLRAESFDEKNVTMSGKTIDI